MTFYLKLKAAKVLSSAELPQKLSVLSRGLINVKKTVTFQFHPLMALVAVSASVLIGIISIVFPARRAVQLDPLDALFYI